MSDPDEDEPYDHPLTFPRQLSLFALQAPISFLLLLVLLAVGAKDAAEPLKAMGDDDFWWTVLWFHLVVLAVQSLLLWPARRPVARRARGVPILVSVGIAGVQAAMLAGAFAFAVVDGFALYEDPRSAAAFFAVVAAAWIVGTLLFRAFVRRRPHASSEELIAGMARRLLAGTAFEAIAQVPLDVLIRRRTECYCFSASILGWAVCIGVGLVVFGPAVLLPVLVRRRAGWYARRCDDCGARLEVVRGDYRTTATRCAACGVKAERATQGA